MSTSLSSSSSSLLKIEPPNLFAQCSAGRNPVKFHGNRAKRADASGNRTAAIHHQKLSNGAQTYHTTPQSTA